MTQEMKTVYAVWVDMERSANHFVGFAHTEDEAKTMARKSYHFYKKELALVIDGEVFVLDRAYPHSPAEA